MSCREFAIRFMAGWVGRVFAVCTVVCFRAPSTTRPATLPTQESGGTASWICEVSAHALAALRS